MKRVLVTGCAGYIGQHLVKLLTGKYELYGIDTEVPSDTTPYTIFKQDNLLYLDEIEFAISDFPTEFDTIIHLAAHVRVGESVRDLIGITTIILKVPMTPYNSLNIKILFLLQLVLPRILPVHMDLANEYVKIL